MTNEQLESLQQLSDSICYSFYRYEINNGLALLESFMSSFHEIMAQHNLEAEKIREINQLLEMILLAVVKKDFLIAADILKYEVLGRITGYSDSSAKRRA